MRKPIAFNDRRLLQEEPFYTAFTFCAKASGKEGKQFERDIRERLDVLATMELKIVPGAVRVLFLATFCTSRLNICCSASGSLDVDSNSLR
jgi:hypothetical protein